MERDGRPLDPLGAQRKALAVLAAIAASSGRGISRDRLLALLWPESDTERARGALKQTVHSLRRQLGDAEAILGTAELRLNPAVIDCDLDLFRAALERGELETALGHYRGPFLDGVHVESAPEFSRWADEVRNELAQRHREALRTGARTAEQAGDHARAVGWWRQLQAADPTSGDVALGLMRALDRAGDPAGAIRHARVHAELVEQELGVAANHEVEALARELVTRPTAVAEPIRSASRPAAATAPASAEPEPPPSSGWRRRWLLPAAGLALALAVVWGARRAGAGPSTTELDPELVAVGEFENATGDEALAPLGKMAADWVVRGLGRTGRLRVLDAGVLYAQQADDAIAPDGALDLARRNGAGLAISGRFYRDGGALVVAANVLDVRTGQVRWALDPVAARAGLVLPAVEELRQRLAAALLAQVDSLGGTYLVGPAASPPTYDAYREFVAGQQRYWSGRVLEGVEGLERAAALDSTFVTARVWLLMALVTIDQCDRADSLATVLERERQQLSRVDQVGIEGARARCERDWETGLRSMRERGTLEPGATFLRWAIAANARRAHRPAEAVAVLRALRPDRDLGWLSDPGKLMYWRELAWSQHVLRDAEGERRAVAGLRRVAAGRLATVYFESLALAGQGLGAEAARALDGVERLPADPPLVAGEIAGASPPALVGTPAWVLYQVATELLAHGDTANATALAARAARWSGVGPAAHAPRETRYQRALALELAGRLDSAFALVEELVREDSGAIAYRGRMGILAARRGDRAAAQAVDAWLAAKTDGFPTGAAQLERARIAAVLGEREQALGLIETLPHRSHPVDVLFFHADPAFGSLRDEPRWTRWLLPRG